MMRTHTSGGSAAGCVRSVLSSSGPRAASAADARPARAATNAACCSSHHAAVADASLSAASAAALPAQVTLVLAPRIPKANPREAKLAGSRRPSERGEVKL